jgi:flagellar hook assembly protein FlgD
MGTWRGLLRFDPAVGASSLTRFGPGNAPLSGETVFDVTGRLVRRLVDGTLPAGDHAIEWDGRTDAMGSMPSGVYLYRLEAGGEAVERRMLLLR